MPRVSCPSCCRDCQDLLPSNNDSPFALKNLIPAGVVNFNALHDDSVTVAALCVHSHAEDDWHAYHPSTSALLARSTFMVDDNLCKQLDFLIQHDFVSATYRFDGTRSIIVRIYLIPYDLPKVQGRLRTRKEAILSPARRYLLALLLKIRSCLLDWNGHSCMSCTPLLDTTKDDRTLSEIYSELPSPEPSIAPRWEELSSRLLNFGDDLKGLGMRSTLFYYQRRSVAALLQKEMDVSPTENPLYICRVDLNGNKFYLQPAKMEILRECPMTSPARGGILCEELGTGKTVMILTLIVATIREISSPEESLQNDTPVMTPVAFRHFPSEFETARRRLLSGKQQALIQSGGFPSLIELLLHHHRTSPNTSVPDLSTAEGVIRNRKRQHFQDKFELTGLDDVYKANIPFCFHYENANDNFSTPRKSTTNGPRIMYLTNATLVVVPANLVSQWDREILKHCEYPVRVLVLRGGIPTPNARSLATDYDIILTTYPRFIAEANSKNISKLHPWKVCQCPPFKEARVPNCQCESRNASPFFQIRWKRLVIDEGHVSSARFSTLIQLVRLLSVERRWIVTGTPTTNLLGLSFGNKTATEDDESMSHENGDEGYPTALSEFWSAQDGTFPSSGSTTRSGSEACTPPRNLSVRIWNKCDRGDLYKLGNMITHFVAVPQFSAEVKLMYNQVTAPLLDTKGPRPGSIQVLTQVMQKVMVRHRIEDIENDVVLPPVMHNPVLLDLEPLAIKSYNALQASIAINAIDSQRTDQDYLFHPSNTIHLQIAVKNMSQLMLWSVDVNLYHADQMLMDEDKHKQRAIKRNTPEEDMQLLYDAFRHIHLAAEDPLWRALQSNEDVPYHVSRMNPRVFEAWTRVPQKDPTTPMMNGFIHVNRILRLHDFVVRRPLASEEVMVEEGEMVSEEELEVRRRFIKAQQKKDKGNKKSLPLQDEVVSELAGNATKKARASDTLKEMQNELSASIARLEESENGLPAVATSRHSGSSSSERSEVPSSSPHTQIRIGHSVSSKINWIINEVKSHSATEKFLIFSDSELSLAHVAEALELIQVKYLRFTAQIEPRYREQLVLTFETSETYRVFLMELKHGARGLNLISASRVIFCEPVWQADVESQAIKRAHRIGQMKKITVTTLAIRGTAEERMVARRELFKGSRDKIPKLIEEAGMRHFIANPKFIETKPELLTTVDEPLFKIKTTADACPDGSSTTDDIPRAAKRLRFEESSPIKEHQIHPVDRIGPEQNNLHKKWRYVNFS